MAFGFEAINTNGSVLISDFQKHLSYMFRSNVSVTASLVDVPATGIYSFPSAINTQAPPTVFGKVISSRHSSMNIYVSVLGSPGSWTGFQIKASAQGGGTLPLYVVDCVVCQAGNLPVQEPFGMAIYDSAGVPVFTNGRPLARFSKFTKKWTYTSNATQNFVFYNFTPDVTIDSDDYIDLTSLNRGAMFQMFDSNMFTSLTIYSSGAPTLRLTSQINDFFVVSTPINLSQQNFCMAICKFPTSIYPVGG